jgi:hypothetical protein
MRRIILQRMLDRRLAIGFAGLVGRRQCVVRPLDGAPAIAAVKAQISGTAGAVCKTK